MRHAVTAGTRRRPRSEADRRRGLRSSLTAAAAPLLATYEMTQGPPALRHFYESALAAGLTEFASEQWPCEVAALDGAGAEFHDGSHCAIWRLDDGTIAYASLHGGWFSVQAASRDLAAAYAACSAFRAGYPASYLSDIEDERVAITFWSMGPFGPQSRLRRIDASPWEPIASNYTAEVRGELDGVMAWHDGPGADGQLMLWQGPPGTGKTWALRALASEWAPWAEFHYITDPDSFFVDNPSYMIDVLLADSYDVMEPTTGDVYQEQAAEGKWRVLILEDTGELLSVNAKEKYGQGLSRLLNVVDGMIGQGLRVLCLVTTNDELGELTPAVRRPGRCASQLTFGPFDPDEASAWLGRDVEVPMTVAEMYALRGDQEDPLPERDQPDDPEPEDARDLAASLTAGAVVAETAKGREIGEVAAMHAPDGGYGDTAWNADEGVVAWVSADWTTDDEYDAAVAAFLAIDGVEWVEASAEAALPEGDEWEVVYRSAALGDPDEAAALAEVLALAAEPLGEIPADPDPPASAQPVSQDAAFAHRALDVIEQFARRPADPAPTFNVHLPGITVARQGPDTLVVDAPITLADGAIRVEPLIDVPAQAPAQISVNVPAQPPPAITVAPSEAQVIVRNEVPAQPPAPVHVTASIEAPKPRVVRVEKLEDGSTLYTQEDVTDV